MKLTGFIFSALLVATSLSAQQAVPQTGTKELKTHRFEIAPEIFSYHYDETVNGAYLMDNRGWMAGANLAWRYHFGQNHIGLSGRYVAGRAAYHSERSGNIDSEPYRYFETRLTHGYNFSECPTYDIVPFWGLGMRLLTNDAEGKVTTTGHHGYLRKSTYIYLPLGSDFTYHLARDSRVNLTAELDLLLAGRQRSYMYNFTADNFQSNGWGFRLSAGYEHDFDCYSLELKPFFRYWKIDDSDAVYNPYRFAFVYEPDNVTKELGLSVSFKF